MRRQFEHGEILILCVNFSKSPGSQLGLMKRIGIDDGALARCFSRRIHDSIDDSAHDDRIERIEKIEQIGVRRDFKQPCILVDD